MKKIATLLMYIGAAVLSFNTYKLFNTDYGFLEPTEYTINAG